MSALISFGEPLIFMGVAHKKCMHALICAVRVLYWSGREGRQQAEAAKRDAAIARNPKGLGYEV